jgi:Phosphoesterase family
MGTDQNSAANGVSRRRFLQAGAHSRGPLPSAPETTVTNEFISSLPIGMGPRVPMLICSPWTQGGYVDSNTYDHTSMNRFLQTWTEGKQVAPVQEAGARPHRPTNHLPTPTSPSTGPLSR